MVSLAAVDDIFDEFDLTPREREVARLILRGHKGSEIMTTLKMALGTFRTHKRMILTKAGVRRQMQFSAVVFTRAVGRLRF